MTDKIPEKMTAVQLDAVGQPLSVREILVPKPVKGEVLAKMTASPINPSDLAFLVGGYTFKTGLPVTPGNEGSGIVVASGGGFLAGRLVGKRVACFAREGMGGAWAEYMVTNASFCVSVGNKLDLEQASMALINPLTALAFINIVKKGKHPAFLNTAAASALGQMLIKLANRHGIPLINVVRKESQAALLKSIGATHVLDSSDRQFIKNLNQLSHTLNARLFFDAVGGPLLGQLLMAAPHGTTILSYGRLSAEPCIIEPGALILHRKNINGFFLRDWMKSRNLIQILGDIRRVKSLLNSDMHTHIKVRYPLAQVNEALDAYKAEMTGGKILFVPALSTE
jgi:NADPH:quinone reductase